MIDWTAPRSKKTAPPMRFVQPVSREFAIDYDALDDGDMLDLEANFLEAAALLTRHRDRLLLRHAPLSKIAAYTPTGAEKPISELTAVELAVLVAELREKAAYARAVAAIEAEMDAAEQGLSMTTE